MKKILFAAIIAILVSASGCCTDCGYYPEKCEVYQTGEVIIKNNLNIPITVTIKWASAPSTDLKVRTFEVGLVNPEIVTGYDYGEGDGEMTIIAEGFNVIPSPMLIDVIRCSGRRYQINTTNGKDAFVSVGAMI